jgi:fatty-acid desaturase
MLPHAHFEIRNPPIEGLTKNEEIYLFIYSYYYFVFVCVSLFFMVRELPIFGFVFGLTHVSIVGIVIQDQLQWLLNTLSTRAGIN